MELDKDFSEFVALFIDHDVQFLIVGGYALAAHGLPRATGDLDAWVRASEGNAVKVFEALKAFWLKSTTFRFRLLAAMI